MNVFPAIDVYNGCAVRLYKGDYDQMTVYSDDPAAFASSFAAKGARYLHVVDLEGARSGLTPNLQTVKAIVAASGLFTQLGGGIRSLSVIDAYRNAGVDRLILGTAAITQPGFVEEAIREFGPEAIAVSVDVKDGLVAIKGWTEVTDVGCGEFCSRMEAAGVRTIICTDISKDGAMAGTNRQLYRDLSAEFSLDVIASGGVSSLEDVRALAAMNLYGAILGKALYTGAVDLAEAVDAANQAAGNSPAGSKAAEPRADEKSNKKANDKADEKGGRS